MLPANLSINNCISVHVAMAGLLAQFAGSVAVRIMETCLSVDIHVPMCREWGAAQVFVESALQASRLYRTGFVATVLLPTFLACNVQLMYCVSSHFPVSCHMSVDEPCVLLEASR